MLYQRSRIRDEVLEAVEQGVVDADALLVAFTKWLSDAEMERFLAHNEIDIYGDSCPGCGCQPGDGRTDGCDHSDGCGYHG